MVFNKSLLSTSIAMAIAATGTATTSYAQEGATEEVVVTGIRGSLMRALDVKRDAKGVVDAISSEDIGKMPDTNLAESLQRITGVSIDRNRGEGARVTVRGFGPDFNLVTLNGRQLPTTGTGRSFDFGNIASEGVAGVQVYKTGKAHVPTGGIGATINVQTTKPLQTPGLKASVGLKGVHDTSTNKGSDLTPEISGIISQTFAEDTFGVALTGSYQERENGVNTANTGEWRNFNGDEGGWGALPDNADQINRPQGDDIYGVPQSQGYEIAEFHRERINGQLTMQWEPVESVTLTADYTYSELTLDRDYSNYSGWMNFGGQQSEYTDGPVAAPIFYSDSAAPDFAMATGADSQISENNSLGFNVEWRPNDNLTLAFDYHDSSAEGGANSPRGTGMQVAFASFTRDRTTVYFDQDLPVMELDLSRPLSADDMILTGSVFGNFLNKMDIEQSQFTGTWDFDEGGSIDFGFATTEVSNRSAGSNVQRDAWGGVSNPGQFADLMMPVSSAGAFDQISGGNDPRFQTDYFTWDTATVIDRIEAAQSLDPSDPDYIDPWPLVDAGDCGTGFCPSTNWSSDLRTTEESTAFYLQVNMEGEMGDKPARISAGLRYEETDVNSQALVPTYADITWVSPNEFSAAQAVDDDGILIQDFTEVNGTYDFILPSLDFSLDITDDIVARVSYSQTITRPGYVDIQGGLTIDQLLRQDGGDGNSGNPSLLPFESQNYDFSVEWYYGEASYASIGYFRKDVKNFIATEETEDVVLFPDLAHPANGPLYADAIANLPADPTNEDIRDYIFTTFPTEPGVDAVAGFITGVAGRDGAATFDVTAPVNGTQDALVDGWEIAIQHTFGESGFGVIANATLVDGDFGFDNSQKGINQFALNGLSDSANLIGFYDKDGLQARLAYNWRDEFLAAGGLEPSYTEEYAQWDMNVSYDITDTMTVFVEGLNITDETTRGHSRTVNNATAVAQTGARYNIGVRASF